ncbi:hypothetical protein OUZ56_016259 [Daphnia magna]|uniref:Uncharacterized protein n=1 Tax=Daphnia magna TaxID=35525 RepID=A0ABR0AQ46_9CRUS|nr:hypothetical protein OUZ56_016259 [Daphnia magna]
MSPVLPISITFDSTQLPLRTPRIHLELGGCGASSLLETLIDLTLTLHELTEELKYNNNASLATKRIQIPITCGYSRHGERVVEYTSLQFLSCSPLTFDNKLNQEEGSWWLVHPDDTKQEVKEPYETVEELQSPLKEPAESTAQDEDTMQQQQLVDNDPSTTSQSQLTDVESLIAQWVTDPECVKEILEDHRNFPPQHKRRDPKENPATQKKLNYFLKVLELKINLAWCHELLQNLYKSSLKHSANYYKQHVPQIKIPSPSLNLGCISATLPENDMNQTETVSNTASPSQLATAHLYSDNSSNIVSLPDELGDKSPSSLPGPLSYKQPILNHTIATTDSSVESGGVRGD